MGKVKKLPKYNNGLASASSIVGSMGQFASMGSMFGGPIGAGIGAAAGLAFGAIQAKQQEDAANQATRLGDIASNISTTNMMNNRIQAEYALNNKPQSGIAGFNKGTPRFSVKKNTLQPNAKLSSEEVVKDGSTGKLSVVPGRYNKKNPDTVYANMTDGSAVYPVNPTYTLPGGESTPADVMARAEKHQNASLNILNSKSGYTLIDKKTAELNIKNIQRQSELMDMNTAINQKYESFVSSQSELPKFDGGRPGKVTPNYSKYTPLDQADMDYDWLTNTDVLAGLPVAGPSIASKIDPITGSIDSSVTQAASTNAAKMPLVSGSGVMSKLPSFLSDIASIAPTLYNLSQSKPEVAKPIYNDYTNPMAMYDMTPELSDIRQQRSIGRYNQKAMGPGLGAAYGASLYGSGLRARSEVFSKANQFNAQQRAGYADRYNNFTTGVAAENRRIEDLNSRNKAAARTFTGTGLSQLSQFVQNKQLQLNQSLRDKQKLDIFKMYAGNSLSETDLTKIGNLFNLN